MSITDDTLLISIKKLTPKSRRRIEETIMLLNAKYTGHIELDCHLGTVAKMRNKP